MSKTEFLPDRVRHTRSPIFDRKVMQIGRPVDLTGLSETTVILRFEHEIIRVRESTCAAILRSRNGGEPLKSGNSFTDFYGLLSSLPEMMEEAEAFAKTYKLGRSSELVAEALVEIVEYGVIEAPQWTKNKTSTQVYGDGLQYLPIPDDWYIDNQHLAMWIAERDKPFEDASKQYNVYELTSTPRAEIEIGKFVAWSSANTDEENAKAFETVSAFRPEKKTV